MTGPMSDLVVKPVATRSERKAFLGLPWRLYQGDPNWIPPLREHQEEMVGYRPHPFYDRNRIQTFLAYRGGRPCGRIAAILNYDYIERHNDLRGFFGFFECVDDAEAAHALLGAVGDWFAGQGIFKLRGPMNPSVNYEMGLLVDGFDSPATFMMSYNPPFYGGLLESYGFRKSQDMYAYLGHVSMMPTVLARFARLTEQIIERLGVRVRSLDRAHFYADVKEFLSIYNRALGPSWSFAPMSQREVEHTAAGLRHLIVPELAVAVEIGGRMVGACFGLPDYNPRIRQIDGRLYPFGFIRLLRKRQQIKRLRVIAAAVLPEYQLQGLGLALMHGIVPKTVEWGTEECEFSWVLESNTLSRGSLEKGGVKIAKTYRVYDLDRAPVEAAAAHRRRAREARVAPRGPLEIRPVESRRDLKRFLEVPRHIYADDPQWVCPLFLEQKEFLDRRHPFYLHGEATQFIALRDGVPRGRILVSDDPRYNARHASNIGCFGMFESEDNPETTAGLLDAAAGWLRARGRSTIQGPIDYSLNYPAGLLVAGFHTPPRIMGNHNPPYYAALLEAWGLAKIKDLYSWWFVDPRDMTTRWGQLAERIERRGETIVRPFRKSDFQAEVQRCMVVYNGAMANNWGFIDVTDAEFHYLAGRMAHLGDPNLVFLAEVGGEPVGFAITLPDINEAIQPLGGRLVRYGMPWNLVRFLWRKRHIKTARMVVLVVLPQYRRRGIAETLIYHTLQYGKDRLGFTGAELGWTLEDNEAVSRTIEAVGGKRYKTYRIYQKELGPASP
ncbi:MAG: GNAT family N-acetyltransferase [Thermoguttaceae bacterium]